jgi:hypothetical protein
MLIDCSLFWPHICLWRFGNEGGRISVLGPQSGPSWRLQHSNFPRLDSLRFDRRLGSVDAPDEYQVERSGQPSVTTAASILGLT